MLRKHVQTTLEEAGREHGLDFLAGRLVVGVSGGPDSLALLHALRSLYPPKRLIVAHLDHGLRPASAADARFVVETAAGWGLTCRVRREDVAAQARKRRLSVEEAGRLARYRFMAEIAREVGAAAVAVAHNADDQAETVLMHLLRGSGPAGLRGMPVAGPLPEAPSIRLLRPLLSVSREEIERYLREQGLVALEDETNRDTTYFRNRLRHELLPQLAAFNPAVKEHLQHLSAVVTADIALLEELTGRAWQETAKTDRSDLVELDRAGWLAQPQALRRRLLRRAVMRCRPDLRDIGFKTIEAARLIAERGTTGDSASLPGGLTLRIGYDRLFIGDAPDLLTDDFPQLPGEAALTLPAPGSLLLKNGWTITAEDAPDECRESILANPDPWTAYVFLPGAKTLTVRPRIPGERLQPLGLDGHYAKIKDVMINRKIPSSARACWPIVATQEHPVWLVGHVIDRRAAVGQTTAGVIRLTCRKAG